MGVPGWVQDAVFYQIFPDRFANGDPSNDPPNVQSWGSAPTTWGFQGGDIQGIIQRLDYLQDLGITALYLNPIFQATSNHRYNTTDYFQIDPKLGRMSDFQQLLERAHSRGMRIVLDGVFNHCGRGFFAFSDLMENGQHSPYLDWFHVRRFPLEAYGSGAAENYLGWWNLKSLPKFNTNNPEVREYLLRVARYWIAQGIDGWRLDVPNEIDDDSFWAEFGSAVKSANPEAYLVGEIWDVNPRWVSPGHFDGLMNYPFRAALLDLMNGGPQAATGFGERDEGIMRAYPWENTLAHLVPIGTHDTERIRTVLGRSKAKVRLAMLLQFAHPGAPCVYYGDEIGLEGGKDPASRAAFPLDEAGWDQTTHRLVQKLAGLRRRLPQLRRGEYRRLVEDDQAGTCAFARVIDARPVMVAANTTRSTKNFRLRPSDYGLEVGSILVEAVEGREVGLRDGELELKLPPYGGVLLHAPQ
ncbi:MAG TPA: glycoside hydrolase family 13 protein [Anaerolineales bacterium]|nr:glycoside hydrolase family 13 protein [Anaerolineales bacterium]